VISVFSYAETALSGSEPYKPVLKVGQGCVLRFFCIIYIIQNAFFVQLVFYTVLYIFIYFLWLDLDLDLDLVFFYSHVFYIYSLFVFYL
jgi:hypothetical protein